MQENVNHFGALVNILKWIFAEEDAQKDNMLIDPILKLEIYLILFNLKHHSHKMLF